MVYSFTLSTRLQVSFPPTPHPRVCFFKPDAMTDRNFFAEHPGPAWFLVFKGTSDRHVLSRDAHVGIPASLTWTGHFSQVCKAPWRLEC